VAAVTAAVASLGDTTALSLYPSNAFTPTAGDLLVVLATVSGSTIDGTCTASANGITFSFPTGGRAIHNSSANSTMLYVANQLVPASPASMTCTVNVTGDAGTGAVVHVASVAGMTNVGLAAVRQVTKQDNGTGGTTPAPVFGSACLTGNPTLVVLGQVSVTATTAPTGWTKLGEASYSTPTIGSAWVGRDSGFTGTTITWGTTSTAFGDVAIELDASAAPAYPFELLTPTPRYL
jgi:hypothetical protein